MKQSTIDLLETKPHLSKEITEQVYKRGMITGSSVFGNITPLSDIDICLPVDFEYSFRHIVTMGGIYEEDYFSNDNVDYFYSVYVKLFDRKKIYNLLFMETQEAYDIWNKATDSMILLSEKDKNFEDTIRDKRKRIQIFEAFKRLYHD